MGTTVKYILIGGAVAAIVYFYARGAGSGAAAPSSSPISDVLGAGKSFIDSAAGLVKAVRTPDVTAQPAPDAPGVSYATASTSPDGLVPSTSDALGYRTRRSYLPAPELLTQAQANLIGLA